MTAVLDASALLALLFNEPGADRVLPYFPDAALSAVNAAEVMTKLVDFGLSAKDAQDMILRLGLAIIPFDLDQARLTAELRLQTRSKGLSLGDRSCLAQAILSRSVAVTADLTWSELDPGCEIDVIR
jgi:ribonuclease VapC